MSANCGYMPGNKTGLNWAPSKMLTDRSKFIENELKTKKKITVSYRNLLKEELVLISAELVSRINEPQQLEAERESLDQLDKLTKWSNVEV